MSDSDSEGDNGPPSPPPKIDELEKVKKKFVVCQGMESVVKSEYKFPFGEGKVIQIRHGDITKERVEAITNAANILLMHAGGLARAIVKAGGVKIQTECVDYLTKRGARMKTSEVFTGSSFKLADQGIKYIMHAVGPVMSVLKARKLGEIGKEDEDKELETTVLNVLKSATEKKVKSISIPAISTGVFNFPKERCAKIMIKAVYNYLKVNETSLQEVRLCNFDMLTVGVFMKEFENFNKNLEKE